MTATATQVVDSPETSATIRIAMRLDGGSLTGASDADISRELTDQSPHAIGGDVDNWFTYESDHQSEPHPIFASKIVLGVIAPWTLFGKDNTKIRVEVTDVSFDYTLLSEISASTASATGITDSRATLHGALTGDGNGLDMTCEFQLGTDTSYGMTPIDLGVQPLGALSIPLSLGYLNPLTTYHYRTRCIAGGGFDGGGTEVWGEDASFTTLAPPAVVTTTPAGKSFPLQSPVETYNPVVRIVSLQAVRTLEVSTRGRFYIDEEGNATWETSAVRNP